MKKTTLLALLLSLLFGSCNKDDSTEQPQWNITISSITDCSAVLNWSSDIDTTKTNSYYELWLDDQLIESQLFANTDTIINLNHKTRYEVKVIAFEEGVSKATVESSFLTRENYPPTDLTITLDSLTSNSVVLNRSDARDPERKPLSYEVSLNGIKQTISPTTKHLTLNNLTPNALNTIRLTVMDNMNNQVTVETTVFTPATENSMLYRYYIDVNGKRRECVLYLPTNYKKTSNLPLLFFFHGAGSYAWDIAQLTRFRDIADKENVVLAYPQATIYDEPNTPSWCVDPGFPADDLPFSDKLIDNLLSNFSVNSKRVYVCGFSSGGYMSFYMALFLSSKITAIAPVAAAPLHYNFSKKNINEPIPLLYIYGTEDTGISGSSWSLSAKETLDFWITNNDCSSTAIETKMPDIDHSNSTTVTLFEYPSSNNNNRILYYRINGGGHWWPGRDYAPTDIIAETVIWDYFKPIVKP